MEDQNLIFLISQPRGGSTILQRLLHNHSEIHSTPEPWIMLHPLYGLRKKGISAEYNVDWANTAVLDFYRSLPQGEETYFKALGHMYLSLYSQALEYSNKSYFLDKTPRYYHIIPELAQTFPKAHFILLFRNPLAVLTSILTTWVKTDYHKLKRFKSDLLLAPGLLVQGTKLLKNKSLYKVSYENLLASLEYELKNMFENFNLTFSPELLNFVPEKQTGFGYKDQSSHFSRSGVDSNNAEKWALKLNNPQHWRFVSDYLEYLGEPTVTSMGYSYEQLREQIQARRPSRFGLIPTLPLEWFFMNKLERANHGKKYFTSRLAIKTISLLSH